MLSCTLSYLSSTTTFQQEDTVLLYLEHEFEASENYLDQVIHRKSKELVFEPKDFEVHADDMNHSTKHTSVPGFNTFNFSLLPTKGNTNL